MISFLVFRSGSCYPRRKKSAFSELSRFYSHPKRTPSSSAQADAPDSTHHYQAYEADLAKHQEQRVRICAGLGEQLRK
jgi:hypothetical protein